MSVSNKPASSRTISIRQTQAVEADAKETEFNIGGLKCTVIFKAPVGSNGARILDNQRALQANNSQLHARVKELEETNTALAAVPLPPTPVTSDLYDDNGEVLTQGDVDIICKNMRTAILRIETQRVREKNVVARYKAIHAKFIKLQQEYNTLKRTKAARPLRTMKPVKEDMPLDPAAYPSSSESSSSSSSSKKRSLVAPTSPRKRQKIELEEEDESDFDIDIVNTTEIPPKVAPPTIKEKTTTIALEKEMDAAFENEGSQAIE